MNTLLNRKETTTTPKPSFGAFWRARRTIFLVLPVLAVLLTTIAIAAAIDMVFFDDLVKNARKEALHDARGAALDISKLSIDYSVLTHQQEIASAGLSLLHKEVRLLSNAFEDRLTIIGINGLVYADSDLTPLELSKAENHAHRPEVDEARLSGHGTSQRSSATLGTSFLYAAIPLQIGSYEFFVRVAKPMKEIFAQRDFIRGLLSLGALTSIIIVTLMSLIFGRQFSKAVKKSQEEKLEFSVNERVAVLGAMQELGSMLAICNTISEAADVIEAQLPLMLPGKSGALTLMNNSRNLMIVEQEWGGEWQKGQYTKPDDCWSLRKNEVHFSNNGDLSCKHNQQFDDGLRIMCVPLMTQGETLGIIHIKEDTKQPFTVESIEIAKSLGREIATALSNLRLRDKLRQQAQHDPLTGLHNRRYLEDEFEVITTRAAYESKRCSLLIIDVDHFKSYNDQYGHDAGDFVLSQLAKLFRKSVGENDIACRLGGEEFGILLGDSEMEKAVEFADDLRINVEALGLIYEGRPLGELTVSIGISSFPDDGMKLPNLLKAADEFLYEAKNTGRNRVCYAKAA